MCENMENKALNEQELTQVNGGRYPGADVPEYSIGQRVRYCHISNTDDTYVVHEWTGHIVGYHHEPEGIFYTVEVEESSRHIVGSTYVDLYYDCIYPI